MTLNNTNCTFFASEITWLVNQEGQFVIKVLSNGLKAKKVYNGYVFRFANVSENSFQLIDKINIGSKPSDLVYQFKRISSN